MKGRNNKMKKSHLLILAGVLVLLVTMCVGISADEGTVATVAKIGETEYTSLVEAIKAAKDGETVIVTADNTIQENITDTEVAPFLRIEKSITIASESADSIKTITVGQFNRNWIYISGAGKKLTLENIKITRTGVANTDKDNGKWYNVYGLFMPTAGGELLLNSGAVIDSVNGGNGAAVFVEGGKVTLNGGTISNCKSSWRGNGGAINIESSGTVELISGTLSGNQGAVCARNKNGIITVSDKVVFENNTNNNVYAPADASVTVNVTEGSLVKMFDAVPGGGCTATVNLASDIAVAARESGTVEVETGKGYYAYNVVSKKCVINGNNHNINLNGNVYLLMRGTADLPTEVTLKDATVLRETSGTYAIFDVKGNTVLNMENGTTIGSDDFTTRGGNGAAVFVEGGTFNLKGGTIKNCISSSRAAVGVDSGTFNMTGGTISGCNAPSAVMPSVLVVINGNANLTGGEMINNGQTEPGNGAIDLGLSWNGKGSGNITVNGIKMENNGMAPLFCKCSTDAAAAITVESVEGASYNEMAGAWYDNETLNKTVAFIGTKPFVSLASAVAYVDPISSSLTIELVKSFNEDLSADNIVINKPSGSAEGKVLTINGNGHTVTVIPKDDKKVGWISVFGDLALENVTFKRTGTANYALFWVHKNPNRTTGGTLTMNDGAVIDGAESGNGAAVFLDGTSTLTMNSGSVIKNCTSTWVGTVWMNGADAKFVIDGGKLENNKGGYGVITATRGSLYLKSGEISNNTSARAVTVQMANQVANAAVYLSGDIVFNNNPLDIYYNLQEANLDKGSLVLDGNFTGKVKISGTDYAAKLLGYTGAYATAGNAIGDVTNSATIKSVDSITSQDGKLFALVKGGKLCWMENPVLSIATDTGKYTKGEDAETVYGVVRAITTAATETEVPVEYFGTYFVKSADAGITAENSWQGENKAFTNESGYIVDYVDITENSATVYAISYYKFAGIEDVVFTAPVPVSFSIDEAKNLGADPEDLKYE